MCKCFEDTLVAVILHFGTEWTRVAFFEQLFLQYSIQLISPKLMWWHMENDDILNILYYDLILPVMFEGCCDLFET